MEPAKTRPSSPASSLALLLAINLFNYIDRYILAAVEPLIADEFFTATDESAMAKTGAAINIKKPQFLAPEEMAHIIRKFAESGNDRIVLCERGSSFGYNNLVVDMLGMDLMKGMAPVVFDATHALQKPGGRSDSAGGRRAQAGALARSGLALGISGLFLEAHPDPDKALCDGPCALPLAALHDYLAQMQAVDSLVKSFKPVVTG